MSESTQLLHHPKTLAVYKELRKVDQFMFGGESIKSGLDKAFETGAVGLFALDCVVSEPVATQEGVGKVPLTDPSDIDIYSGFLCQRDPIVHVTSEFIWAGLQVSWWAFIGDDDFAHSVSPEYSVDHGEVVTAITSQIDVVKYKADELSEQFPQPLMFQSKRGTIMIRGWLEAERSDGRILHDRSAIAETLLEGIKKESLPKPVAKRLGQMKEWRHKTVNASGLSATETESLIGKQAIEEMASFMVQGLHAPSVIHKEHPDIPLIFANTFPNLSTHQLDDSCLRFPASIGLIGEDYGTIHLSGPGRLAKALDRSKKLEPGKVLTCGDPKGNKNY